MVAPIPEATQLDPETMAKLVGVVIGTTVASSFAVWKVFTGGFRHKLRKKLEARSDSPSELEETNRRNPNDTGEFLVRVMEPEIRRQHQQYGRRLEDLNARFDEHMEEAVPAMRMVVELKTRVDILEKGRQDDKHEIIEAIDKHEGRMSNRLDSIEAYLRGAKV